MQRNGNKRFSGVYDPQPISSAGFATGSNLGLARRGSKKSSNKDRRGQVSGSDEDTQPGPVRSVTPDSAATTLGPTASTVSDGASSSLSNSTTTTSRSHALRGESIRDRFMANADNKTRPRTQTLDERARTESFGEKVRNRMGSVNTLQSAPVDPNSSIGFPSIISSGPSAQQKRSAMKSPSRPLSPVDDAETVIQPGLPSPNNDVERMIQLMKTTAGRMHGILYFRLSKSGPWSSGYCAINVASGTLIYQMKGDVSHAKTLIPDLRGCTVRTQLDPDPEAKANTHFLEIASKTSSFGVHLKPHVSETIESWLAALLCWQPLSPKGTTTTKNIGTVLTAKPSIRQSITSPRRNSGINLLRDAAIIKVGKMLYWDRDTRPPGIVASTQRISTYREQRSASGTAWKKVSCTLQENGLLKLYGEPDNTPIHQIPLSTLNRCAIQRLHPTVMEDEFCLAIYPQYQTSNAVALNLNHPIFLSLETRILFEVWYVLLRVFTTPELYGPEQSSIRASVDLSTQDPKRQVSSFDQHFRVERVLSLRIIEAKIFATPQENADSSGKPSGRTRGTTTTSFIVGDYYAEVRIDGEIRGRTAIKTNDGNPFWREDYEFHDLPPVIKSAVVSIKARNRSLKDWVAIVDGKFDNSLPETDHLGLIRDLRVSPIDATVGEINLQLEGLDRGKDTESWWSLLNDQDEIVGEMLMRLRIDEAVVLMSKHYEPVFEMLCKFGTGLTQQIAFAVPTEYNRLHETLLNIFQFSGHAADWLMSLVEDEIDGIHKDTPAPRYRYSRRIASHDAYDSGVERELTLREEGKTATQEANLLFRGNSLLTKALDLHMRRLGKEFLEETLGERIRDIDESNPDCEVDPNRIKQNEDLPRNWRNLIALTESFWIAIKGTLSRCPVELRIIFRHIRACADDRYGAFLRNIKYSSVSGFLFLRFFCPAVLNPKLFGLLKDHPRPRALRTLTFIAKSLQCLANLTAFGNKEPWMEPMNQFISSHRQEFKDYVDQICTISADQSASRIPPSYATPQTILSRLPPTAKEGFPSLPYLIDQARELATLTNGWIEVTGDNRPTVQDGEDIAAFDRLCYTIREQTSSTIERARRADQPSGAIDDNLEGVAETYDRRTRSSLYQDSRPSSSKIEPDPTSPISPISPVSLPAHVIHHFRTSEGYQSTSTHNSSQASLHSDSEAPLSPGHQRRNTRKRISLPVHSPAMSVLQSPVGWDPSESESVEQFPSHAISWDKSNAGRHRRETREAESTDDDSYGTRQDQVRTLRTKETGIYTNGADSVGLESPGSPRSPFTMSASTYEDKPSISPRESGRKFPDVWGFRRKDKEREKDRPDSTSDILGRSEKPGLTMDKRATLTKRDRERDKREREREKEVRVLLENPKALRDAKDSESKGKDQLLPKDLDLRRSLVRSLPFVKRYCSTVSPQDSFSVASEKSDILQAEALPQDCNLYETRTSTTSTMHVSRPSTGHAIQGEDMIAPPRHSMRPGSLPSLGRGQISLVEDIRPSTSDGIDTDYPHGNPFLRHHRFGVVKHYKQEMSVSLGSDIGNNLPQTRNASSKVNERGVWWLTPGEQE